MPSPAAVEQAFEALRNQALERRQRLAAAPGVKISIGMATCGLASGALETRKAFEEILAERRIQAHIRELGCLGHCYGEPLVILENPGFPPILYHQVTPGKARMLVKSFLEDGDPLFEHILGAMEANELIPTVTDFPRFNREMKIITENCGRIDPHDIHDYLAAGGYAALLRVLLGSPGESVAEVAASGLRGRGGAGFPTGTKWRLAQEAPGPEKYVICNADEGDPGAYMDRTILESDPHRVLEGLAVAALTVGARRAIVYVRAEYPLAVRTVSRAIEQAIELGLLGPDILGSGISLEVSVFQGSGAFVCGEETALIASIEGRRGMPRLRPPYPVKRGLWGHPTLINNVKTLSAVPPILSRGAGWFRRIGTPESPGTAVFSVVGDVVHPGLVEVPTGVSLRTLIFDICGGIPHRKDFKAVQIGGPSGGCLGAPFLDTPIDFGSLSAAGAMMGSGGLVVMDEDTCMVDVARFFLDFTQKESCGKCTFCRIGTRHLLEILERLTRGEGLGGDLELLQALSEDVRQGSLCGLGKTAPNPVLTSLRYFRAEYEAHLRERRCPACVCRRLTAYYIDLGKCARGCDACVGCCPVEAIFTTPDRKKGIDQSLCVKCGECLAACPPEYKAVRRVSPAEQAPVIKRAEKEMQKAKSET